MQMPPEMVIFDCDGVIVDSETLSADVLCASLERHGLSLTRDAFMEIALGGTIKGVAQTAREMGAQLPSGWVDDVYEEIFSVLEAEVTAIDGIVAVLDQLDAAGIVYAVGSNGPHRKMQITLGRTGLLSRFQGRIWSREDVPTPKPAPDVYLKAASKANVPAERCVVVEDSAPGARAAKAADMYCIGFAAETDPLTLEPVCDELFDHMDELPGLLGLVSQN